MKKIFCILMVWDFFVFHCINFSLKIFQSKVIFTDRTPVFIGLVKQFPSKPETVLKWVLNRPYQTELLESLAAP